MLVSDVINKVKAYCNGAGIEDATSRDQVLWGPTDRECTGIVTCIWASADVIREAARRGANLVISHEALFWNHGDHTDWLEREGNRTFAAKRELLEETGVTVWRCHDHIHAGIPSPEGKGTWVDGIFWGLADRLGWQPVDGVRPLGNQAVLCVTDLSEPRTAEALGREVARALGTRGVRLIGNPTTPVRRAGVAMHLFGSPDSEAIRAMDGGIDCLLAMETTDYTVLEYVQDASQLGRPRAVLSCGHFNLEAPGMEYMVRWLPAALGADAPEASYVAAGDPFRYVTV